MFLFYKRESYTEMRRYVEGEALDSCVSISELHRAAGSPKKGDMIARNQDDHSDQWLITGEYFTKNYNTEAGYFFESGEPVGAYVLGTNTPEQTEDVEPEDAKSVPATSNEP